jgi:class 3 adenylate cyclase/tetratricopeptide (TPR) repeat protein
MDVAAWLKGLGLEQYASAFRENQIDDRVLPTLTADDLKELGVTALGPRRRLLDAIAELRKAVEPEGDATREQAPSSPDDWPAPGTGRGERRYLTVLFCDLVGSTSLSVKTDPEDLRGVIAAYYKQVADVVVRFGGYVARYVGDGILAYFGYPQAHEEDAERAVRAGLALTEAVRRIPAPEPLQVRVGIATGLVVVGEVFGEGAAQERTVVGETPNLAARLQQWARPGEIVISASTQVLTGGLFKYERIEPQFVKGLPNPVGAWRVTGESAVASRFEALRGPHVASLVGREEQLDLLLRRWERAKGGSGRAVLITGEPGIGKSRLIRALEDRLDGDVVRLHFFCASHHQNTALHPVVSHIEAEAGLAPDDSAELKLAKLGNLLSQSGATGEITALIAGLFSIVAPEPYRLTETSPRSLREKTLTALLTLLAGLAAREPVLLIYEDVHWIDPTTLELLERIVAQVPTLRALLLITGRPEFKPPWPEQAHVTTLPLNRLSGEESTALACHVAGEAPLAPGALQRIVRQAEGVPLFVEEITKAYLEADPRTETAWPSSPVPVTLHDLLLARLDRLGPAREVAQIGAVIGREFRHELLGAIADQPETALMNALARLVSSELLFRSGTPPHSRYSFKHVLIQQAAYESLLHSRRRELHGRIAEVLARGVGDDADQDSELLVHHASAAGKHALAVQACRDAAERCLRIFANEEAYRLAERGLAELEHLEPGRERIGHLIALLAARAFAAIGPGGRKITELMDRLRAAADSATEMGLHGEATNALVSIAVIEQRLNRLEQASQASMRAEQLSRSSDPATHCRQVANTARCLLEVEREIPRAFAMLRDAESQASALGLCFTELQWARAHAARWQGDLDGAHAMMADAYELARAQEMGWRESGCLLWLAIIDLERGNFGATKAYCERLSELAVRTGQGQAPVADALRALANLLSCEGDAWAALDRSLAALREFDDKAQLAYVLNRIADFQLAHGRVAEARIVANEALANALAVRHTTEIIVARAILGRALGAEGERASVVAWWEDLISNSKPDALSARARSHLEIAGRELGSLEESVRGITWPGSSWNEASMPLHQTMI